MGNSKLLDTKPSALNHTRTHWIKSQDGEKDNRKNASQKHMKPSTEKGRDETRQENGFISSSPLSPPPSLFTAHIISLHSLIDHASSLHSLFPIASSTFPHPLSTTPHRRDLSPFPHRRYVSTLSIAFTSLSCFVAVRVAIEI
ncbi:hypothetical protein YC2023_045074 [Brassica napus]